jgi:predicted ATPase
MIYLQKLKVLENSNFKGSLKLRGLEFECQDLNLIVGNQGSGKSTLLNMLHTKSEDLKLQLSDFTIKSGVDVFLFDSEKDNPRIKNPQSYIDISGKSTGIGFSKAHQSRFMSHGEVLQKFTIEPLLIAKDSIILLDEPESGLSIQNQFKLIDAIKTALSNNCQLFIATHCYPLIMEFDVYSIEDRKFMKGSEYIKNIKNGL